MSRDCKVQVVPIDEGGVSIWCDTCKESIAWKAWFSVEEVCATAEGHKRVMRAARGAS